MNTDPFGFSCSCSHLARTAALSAKQIFCRSVDSSLESAEFTYDNRITLVTRGAFARRSGRSSLIADPARAILSNPGEEYKLSHLMSLSDQRLVVSFNLDHLDGRLAKRVSKRGHACALPLPAGALVLAQKLSRCAARNETLRAEEILTALFESVVLHDDALAHAHLDSASSRPFVIAARELIASAPQRTWRLADLARQVGVSEFHLARQFRRWTGQTIHAYQTQLRMAEALERVRNGETNLTALAFDLGYSSHSHFSTTFRKTFGFSPNSARDRLS